MTLFDPVWSRYHALIRSDRSLAHLHDGKQPFGGLKDPFKQTTSRKGRSSTAASSRQPSESRSAATSLGLSRKTDPLSSDSEDNKGCNYNEEGRQVINFMGGISDIEEPEEKPTIKHKLSSEYGSSVAGVVERDDKVRKPLLNFGTLPLMHRLGIHSDPNQT